MRADSRRAQWSDKSARRAHVSIRAVVSHNPANNGIIGHGFLWATRVALCDITSTIEG